MKATDIQKKYYEHTAKEYDKMHLGDTGDVEHVIALRFLSSYLEFFNIKSILDIGAGTGRTIEFIQQYHPNVKIVGIEPVHELREQGYSKGISREILIDGDGNSLSFEDDEFDLVCEFAVLHHVANPEKVVNEMLRVGKKGIFISDSNNFGQGNFVSRSIKQTLNAFGLWRFFNFIRTKGRRYQISEEDGLYYSYSVFNNLSQIKRKCSKIFLLDPKSNSVNLYRSASHVALLGIV